MDSTTLDALRDQLAGLEYAGYIVAGLVGLGYLVKILDAYGVVAKLRLKPQVPKRRADDYDTSRTEMLEELKRIHSATLAGNNDSRQGFHELSGKLDGIRDQLREMNGTVRRTEGKVDVLMDRGRK